MKLAKVSPVHKKEDKQESGNYRPISVLPTLSKIQEKLVYKRLMHCIEQYNILTDIQHGFREYKSTQSASQSFIEYIQEAMDKRFYVVDIFLDLTKAYDILNHDILLDKLNFCGIRGTTEKTAIMFLHFHINQPTVRLGIFLKNEVILYLSKLKFLGIALKENLKWNSHIQAFCLNLSKVTFMIKSLRTVVSEWTLRSITNSN
jgi:hypothetical protein